MRKRIVEIVKDLTSYPNEADWFEFKENWFQADGIGEYISSLSNAAAMIGREAGYLIWGVNNDTHELTGTTFNFRQNVRNEPLEHYLARNVTPDVNFRFAEGAIDGKRIVVLTVPAAKTVPTSYKNVRYFRIGSSKVNLVKYPEREADLFHVLTHGLPSIENMESPYQDPTFEQLFVYYSVKGITLNKRTFKKNLGLLTSDGKYNMLAQLLSDDPHIPIRFSLFKGKSKASTLYAVREFGNRCLLTALERVLDYGEVLNVPQADERNRVVERKEVMLFDEEAFREAVVNAFVHNLWVTGNEPMFTVYEDRIEILSRGTLAPSQTIDGFFAGESVPVNSKLAEIFLQVHLSEKSGRGVPKVVQVYGRDAYEFRKNSIVVTIPFNKLNIGNQKQGSPYDPQEPPKNPSRTPQEPLKNPSRTPQEPPKNPPRTPQALVLPFDNSPEERIWKLCAKPKTTQEIMELLQYKDRKTVRNHLNKLLEQGRIAMTIPDKPKSKYQKYIAIK